MFVYMYIYIYTHIYFDNMAACSTRVRRFSDDSSGLNDSEQKSQRSQRKLTRKVTQEADDGKKCTGLKNKRVRRVVVKRFRTGLAIGLVKGLDGGIDSGVGEGVGR